jgi:hypothetical protein
LRTGSGGSTLVFVLLGIASIGVHPNIGSSNPWPIHELRRTSRTCAQSGLALFLAGSAVHAHGLLIPDDKNLPPLAMLNHKVSIQIDDQLAVTRVEQSFRNHTDRNLEATYIFPVPAGASVNRFSMWVNGKETKGELVEAKKAGEIYTSIVRRTQDPALLEYMGNHLLRLRVFPIPPRADQKVALGFTSVASKEGKLVEYVYPLKTNGKATSTLEEFSLTATHQKRSQRNQRLQSDALHLPQTRQRSRSDHHLRSEPGSVGQGFSVVLRHRRQGCGTDGADTSTAERRQRLFHAAD